MYWIIELIYSFVFMCTCVFLCMSQVTTEARRRHLICLCVYVFTREWKPGDSVEDLVLSGLSSLTAGTFPC